MTLSDLENRRLTDLYKLAKEYQIPYYGQMKKKELIFAILKARAERDGLLFMEGVLDILPEGYGFLRPINYFPPRRTSTSRLRKSAGLICAPAIWCPGSSSAEGE